MKLYTPLAGILTFITTSMAVASPTTSQEKLGLSVSGHAHFGVGLNLNEYPLSGTQQTFSDPNPYGFGVGARMGYTAPFNLYIGGVFDYYFGSSTEVSVADIASLELSASSWNVAGEIGYDLELFENFTIRPLIGLGYYELSGSLDASNSLANLSLTLDGDVSSFAISPGLMANIVINEVIFATGGLHAVLPTEQFELAPKSLTFSVGVGARF